MNNTPRVFILVHVCFISLMILCVWVGKKLALVVFEPRPHDPKSGVLTTQQCRRFITQKCITVMILSFRTNRSGQTADPDQTAPRGAVWSGSLPGFALGFFFFRHHFRQFYFFGANFFKFGPFIPTLLQVILIQWWKSQHMRLFYRLLNLMHL